MDNKVAQPFQMIPKINVHERVHIRTESYFEGWICAYFCDTHTHTPAENLLLAKEIEDEHQNILFANYTCEAWVEKYIKSWQNHCIGNK